MSLKNPVTPPGIDSGFVRLVAQRLNHYATSDPSEYVIRIAFALQKWLHKRASILGYTYTQLNKNSSLESF
jgi:hypothetical protein